VDGRGQHYSQKQGKSEAVRPRHTRPPESVIAAQRPHDIRFAGSGPVSIVTGPHNGAISPESTGVRFLPKGCPSRASSFTSINGGQSDAI
jgi:hypothetical protein